MNRIEELINDINLYLKNNDLDESYIIRPDDRCDNEIWLTNLMNVTNEVSLITIESKEDVSDRWGEVSCYKMVTEDNGKSYRGYTIILSSQAERMGIESIEDLAEVIEYYEKEFNSLSLTIK